MMSLEHLNEIIQGGFRSSDHKQNDVFSKIVTDSRKVVAENGAQSLFFALIGPNHDGHLFCDQAFQNGIRNFVVSKPVDLPSQANVIRVGDTLRALQRLASFHRSRFSWPVVGITGSNGKTMVKEWLSQLLSIKYNVARSPKSFNSQVGVPLSLLHIQDESQIGVFEAGISESGEMSKLQEILRPDLGIFTNLGSAHDAGFASRQQKASEKALLFSSTKKVICCADHNLVLSALKDVKKPDQIVTWSLQGNGDYNFSSEISAAGIIISLTTDRSFYLPVSDYASQENLLHCIVFLIEYGFSDPEINRALERIEPIDMRLQYRAASDRNYLIDDSYNNDLIGLELALDFLEQQKGNSSSAVILGDILESGLEPDELYRKVNKKLSAYSIDHFFAVGKDIVAHQACFSIPGHFYADPTEVIRHLQNSPLQDTVILVKGPRKLKLEKISQYLTEKIHQTVLEINLNHLTHNLNFYREKLDPGTKLMVMVKAFAYGSGNEIASLLEHHRVDYLAVAYADEGVRLRRLGITVPIMVMNPLFNQLDTLYAHQLEPEVYSSRTLKDLIQFADQRKLNVHLKVDTGMHRLGFEPEELDEAIELLRENPNIQVASMFSHLVGSDDEQHHDFSLQQINKFSEAVEKFERMMSYRPLAHILNSPGILRYSKHQMDMVRLGIGLYGFDTNQWQEEVLENVVSLKTVVSQIKHIRQGETIGYSRAGVAHADMKIATLGIGYADGLDRKLSKGLGHVFIRGQKAPIVGNVCMDMTMVDVSQINCQEGDEAVIFENQQQIRQIATTLETIPYEIISRINERVKRVYYFE